jgi:3-dehydroquinate dehydratase-2
MLAVLNGVNLDRLGSRDATHYGDLTLDGLETQIYAWARELGTNARCLQTNFEGQFVEHLHDAPSWAMGLVINPGAWTHYAWAIRDAVELTGLPFVEVHLSDVDQREEWRRFSVLSELDGHRIAGHGATGYREAMEWLLARPAGAG